jgi:hypothetical protein
VQTEGAKRQAECAVNNKKSPAHPQEENKETRGKPREGAVNHCSEEEGEDAG